MTDSDHAPRYAGPGEGFATAGFIAADGIYRIVFMDTQGDTRGQDWHQVMTVIAVNGGAPSPKDVYTCSSGTPMWDGRGRPAPMSAPPRGS